MAYKRTIWKSGAEGGTLVTDERLNNIEDGIQQALAGVPDVAVPDAVMTAVAAEPTSQFAILQNATIDGALVADQPRQAAMFAVQPTSVPSIARQVIIDTDMQTDPGDLGAFRVALYYERAGFLDILGAIVDTNSPSAAPVTDVFARNGGRVLQIGQVGASHADLTAAGGWHSAVLAASPPRYGGADASQFVDGISLYRHLLANASGPVDILSIGTLTALYGLMTSTADAISALTGMQLINAKVGHLWVMGGKYPSGSEHNFSASGKSAFSASYVFANWPTTIPLTCLGFEAGDTIVTHRNLIADAPPSDLFLTALTSYQGGFGKGPEEGRPAWDELLIRLAALGGATPAGYTTVQGTNVVNSSTGANVFTPSGGGPHAYVVKALTDQQYIDAINAINILGQEPVPAGAQWRTSVVGSSVPILQASAAPSAPQGLPILARMKAADAVKSGVVDGGAVAWLPSHGGAGPSWLQNNPTKKPTYRANIGGLACLEFAGGQVLMSGLAIPYTTAGLTILARVRFATVPAAAQGIAGADSGTRIWQFKTDAAGAMQAINFTGGTGRTDLTATAQLTANTWVLVAMRYDATSLEAFVNGATNGPLTTTAPNAASLLTAIGALDNQASPTSPLTGYVADVKFAIGKATDAQLALLSADM